MDLHNANDLMSISGECILAFMVNFVFDEVIPPDFMVFYIVLGSHSSSTVTLPLYWYDSSFS